MTKLLLKKANLQVLLIEREKKSFSFLFLNNMKSHQSTVLWSGHKKVGPVWGPSWSHSSQSFSRIAVVQGIVITAQKVSSFLHKISQNTSPHHGIYLLFCFVSFLFLIYLRSSVKLEFLKASQHQNSTRFVEVSIFFRTYIHTLSLSCLCQEFCKRKGQSKVLVEKTGNKNQQGIKHGSCKGLKLMA